MAEQSANSNSTSYVRTGVLIVIIGVIVLLITRSFVKNNLAGPEWLWPIILFGCAMFVAVAVIRSPIFSPILAAVILLGLLSFGSGNNLLRKLLGLACIGIGFLLIYHVIARLYLAKNS